MTVFRGYLKVMRHSWALILLYLGIFFGCTIFMQFMAGYTEKDYQAVSLKVGIIDEDRGEFAEVFREYLGEHHNIISLNSDISDLQEKLFYRKVEYIIRIPSDFYEKCVKNEETLSVTTIPGTYSGIYVDQQINSFLNNARAYQAAGFSESEAASALGKRVDATVVLADGDNAAKSVKYKFYFQYIPYLFLALFGFVTGSILIVFSKKEVKSRMLASPISAKRQSLEGLLCMICSGTVVFFMVIAVAILFYGKEFYGSGNLGYYLLNTAAIFFVSMSCAYLAGTLAPNKDALTGIVNVISLGMCFLCGVFVPMEFISTGVKKISQFLPVYWYEVANEILGDFSVLTEDARMSFFQAVGIQLVFGLVFVCLTLVLGKYRRIEN